MSGSQLRVTTIQPDQGPELEVRVSGDAPSVLFVHGACCQAAVWDALMLALLDRGIASAAVSLRGHGGSQGTEHLQRYRIEHYVEDVLQTLGTLVRPVTLIGHSMGGLVCQLAAARANVRRLVLIAPSPVRGMRRDGMRMVFRHPYTFLCAFLQRSFLRLYRKPRALRSLLFHASTPETVIADAANILVEESWRAGNEMNTILPDPAQIRCPVIILGGAEDFMVSPASIELTALAYNVEPVFVPASGHMIQSEISASRLAGLLQPYLTD